MNKSKTEVVLDRGLAGDADIVRLSGALLDDYFGGGLPRKTVEKMQRAISKSRKQNGSLVALRQELYILLAQ